MRARSAFSALLVAGLALVPLPVAAATPVWSSAGNLSFSRYNHTATLLNDRRVLVAGGEADAPTDTVEIFTPGLRGGWRTGAAMSLPRTRHAASVLSTGQVLVTGGLTRAGSATATAELYNPTDDSWIAAPPMLQARYGHRSTALPDGRILVTGGAGPDAGGGTAVLRSAETYDPSTGKWTAVANMGAARKDHGSVLMADGQVLIAGGSTDVGDNREALAAGERFNPATNSWAAAGTMAVARSYFVLAVLADARVIAVGGLDFPGGFAVPTTSVDFFDPLSGWSAGPPTTYGHGQGDGAVLSDGSVLVVGGNRRLQARGATSAELLAPGARSWRLLPTLPGARVQETVTGLSERRALVVGSSTRDSANRTLQWLPDGSLFPPRVGPKSVGTRGWTQESTLLAGLTGLLIASLAGQAAWRRRRPVKPARSSPGA